MLDPLQLVIEHMGDLDPGDLGHGLFNGGHRHHDASECSHGHSLTLRDLVVGWGSGLSLPTLTASLLVTLLPTRVTFLTPGWAGLLPLGLTRAESSSIAIPATFSLGGCIRVVRVDRRYFGILCRNLQFGHLPTLLTLYGLSRLISLLLRMSCIMSASASPAVSLNLVMVSVKEFVIPQLHGLNGSN